MPSVRRRAAVRLRAGYVPLPLLRNGIPVQDAVAAQSHGAKFCGAGRLLERYIGPDQEVLIPEGIVRIGERAFAGSGIESVRFPASVTYVAAYAFADCPLLTRLEFCSLPHMESRAF